MKYLSPTSFKLFESDKEKFFLIYLTDQGTTFREPQTPAMAVGSSFDAFIKNYLHRTLFGKGHPEADRFDLTTIFEKQVESNLRDEAYRAGKYLFDEYISLGCAADLLTEMGGSIIEPRFEFDLMGDVESKSLGSVTLKGKPDLYYINREGMSIEHDWKINGYYSNKGPSPLPGYIKCRTNIPKYMGKESSGYKLKYKGMTIGSNFLESCSPDWAAQLSIYAWLEGSSVGSEILASVDQACCSVADSIKINEINFPGVRFAQHRLRISSEYQINLFQRLTLAWEIIHSDHYFRELSYEDSKKRCEVLQGRGKIGNRDDIFSKLCK